MGSVIRGGVLVVAVEASTERRNRPGRASVPCTTCLVLGTGWAWQTAQSTVAVTSAGALQGGVTSVWHCAQAPWRAAVVRSGLDHGERHPLPHRDPVSSGSRVARQAVLVGGAGVVEDAPDPVGRMAVDAGGDVVGFGLPELALDDLAVDLLDLPGHCGDRCRPPGRDECWTSGSDAAGSSATCGTTCTPP